MQFPEDFVGLGSFSKETDCLETQSVTKCDSPLPS